MRQNELEKQLDEKVHRDDFTELKDTLKELSTTMTNLRIEQAEWRTVLKEAIERNSGNG